MSENININNDKLIKNRQACKKYREKNKDKIKDKLKILRSTSEFKNKRNQKLKEKRIENPIKEREYQKEWRLKNPNKFRESQRKYRLKNPDKFSNRKRADKDKQRENITDEYVKVLLRNKIGIPYREVKKYSKLIELHRQIIKIKRYAKQNKN